MSFFTKGNGVAYGAFHNQGRLKVIFQTARVDLKIRLGVALSQFCFNQILHLSRIGFAFAGFHHLADDGI